MTEWEVVGVIVALEAEDTRINDHEIRITVLEHDKSEGV